MSESEERRRAVKVLVETDAAVSAQTESIRKRKRLVRIRLESFVEKVIVYQKVLPGREYERSPFSLRHLNLSNFQLEEEPIQSREAGLLHQLKKESMFNEKKF
jgi:hypothetical protein